MALDDGTTKTYTLDKDNSTGVTKDSKNLLCTYTLSDNEIALDAVTGTTETSHLEHRVEKGKAKSPVSMSASLTAAPCSSMSPTP